MCPQWPFPLSARSTWLGTTWLPQRIAKFHIEYVFCTDRAPQIVSQNIKVIVGLVGSNTQRQGYNQYHRCILLSYTYNRWETNYTFHGVVMVQVLVAASWYEFHTDVFPMQFESTFSTPIACHTGGRLTRPTHNIAPVLTIWTPYTLLNRLFSFIECM